jgi:hypothetical protein
MGMVLSALPWIAVGLGGWCLRGSGGVLMTETGWRNLVLKTFDEFRAGHTESFELLIALLHEQDQAKNRLREKGYGVTGMPWIEMVEEVPHV